MLTVSPSQPDGSAPTLAKPILPLLNYEQQRCLELMKSGINLFVTGGAGTGKSTLIRAFMAFMESTSRQVLLVAPTGIAASRIGGSTIHRTFGLSARLFPPAQPILLTPDKEVLLQQIDTIVVDEVSMTRVDTLTAMDLCLQQANGNRLPFGGKQVILVGDLFQLSPVARREDQFILRQWYEGILPIYAHGWRYGNFQSVVLHEIHRQADPVFVNLLNEIRTGGSISFHELEFWGDMLWVGAVHRLNRLVPITYSYPSNAVVLCPTNDLAARINAERDALNGDSPSIFYAQTTGKVDFNEISAEEVLRLQVGSRVIMLANKLNADETDFEFANGDAGVILAITETKLSIRLDRGSEVQVARRPWEIKEAQIDIANRTLTEETVGMCFQFPVKLGYSISIHKSQGLTLDRVHLCLGRPMFAPGQLYCAISRCRTLAGLSFSRPIQAEDVLSHPEVEAFYRELG
jgi:ATP-dependent exoDNAse (exonuclease V) alpha subunit